MPGSCNTKWLSISAAVGRKKNLPVTAGFKTVIEDLEFSIQGNVLDSTPRHLTDLGLTLQIQRAQC